MSGFTVGDSRRNRLSSRIPFALRSSQVIECRMNVIHLMSWDSDLTLPSEEGVAEGCPLSCRSSEIAWT